MDAEFKKEHIGTLFVWVGALEGGLGGGGGPQGCLPQKVNVPSKTNSLLQQAFFFSWVLCKYWK